MKVVTKSGFKYLIELVIVSFGVFLGTYINDLQQKSKLDTEKEKAISFVKKELNFNKKLLSNAISYHQKIKPEIDSITRSLSQDHFMSIYFNNIFFNHNQIEGWSGLKYAPMENIAFESIKISGLFKEYDLSLIQSLSKFYQKQQVYLDYSNTLLKKMVNIDSNTKVIDMIGILQLMTSDLLSIEESLIQEIEKLEELLSNIEEG